MNASERDELLQFLAALRQTRADPKDAQADALIREAVSQQGDASYLLVQRAMGLALALQAAQAQTQQLQAQNAQLQAQLLAHSQSNVQAAQPAKPSGFWTPGAQAWGRGPESSAPGPASATAQTPPLTRPSAATAGSAWGGGILAQVATTAAGVVAGGLLFQGIQGLMGHNSPTPSPSPSADQGMPLAQSDDLTDGADPLGDLDADWA